MELGLDPNHSVRMYQKTFDYQTNTVFRVVVTETTLVPAGHTKVLPAHIPNWKRPPVTLNAVFEPQSKFSNENEFSDPSILLNYSEQGVLTALENKADTDVIIYKNTTLGFSEVIPDGWLNGVSPCRNPFPSLNSASTTCATLTRQLILLSHQTTKTSSKTLFRNITVFSQKTNGTLASAMR